MELNKPLKLKLIQSGFRDILAGWSMMLLDARGILSKSVEDISFKTVLSCLSWDLKRGKPKESPYLVVNEKAIKLLGIKDGDARSFIIQKDKYKITSNSVGTGYHELNLASSCKIEKGMVTIIDYLKLDFRRFE